MLLLCKLTLAQEPIFIDVQHENLLSPHEPVSGEIIPWFIMDPAIINGDKLCYEIDICKYSSILRSTERCKIDIYLTVHSPELFLSIDSCVTNGYRLDTVVLSSGDILLKLTNPLYPKFRSSCLLRIKPEQIEIRPINGYRFQIPSKNDTLFSRLVGGFWKSHFVIKTRDKSERITLNEPFYFNSNYITIQRLDPFAGTIKYSTQRNLERPIGYKEGFYVNSTLLKNIQKYYGYTYSQNRTKYQLFYFWGTWCGLCIKTMPDLAKEIDRAKGKIQAFGFPMLAKDESVEDVVRVARNNGLYIEQLVLNNEYDNLYGIPYNLNIFSYPTYLLMDSDNQILYRGNSIEKLKSFLDKL